MLQVYCVGTVELTLRTAKAITGDPEVRKFVLSMFRKLDPNVNGPIEIEESVSGQLQVIRDLTEENSGKYLSHHGDNINWF